MAGPCCCFGEGLSHLWFPGRNRGTDGGAAGRPVGPGKGLQETWLVYSHGKLPRKGRSEVSFRRRWSSLTLCLGGPFSPEPLLGSLGLLVLFGAPSSPSPRFLVVASLASR